MIKYQYGFDHLEKTNLGYEDNNECDLESDRYATVLKTQTQKVIPPKKKIVNFNILSYRTEFIKTNNFYFRIQSKESDI